MAYNNQNSQRVSTDRFGRSYTLKFAAQAYSKKQGSVLDNIFKTRVQIGGKEYEVEVSPAQKTKEIRGQERNGMWVKVTHIPAQSARKSGSL